MIAVSREHLTSDDGCEAESDGAKDQGGGLTGVARTSTVEQWSGGDRGEGMM